MSLPAYRFDPLPDFLSDAALGDVLAAVPQARMVGGCVRDALLGRGVADIDLATPDPPEVVMAALREAGLKAVPTGLAHGTVTAVARHLGFEITTLRRDVATDGRHAVVAFTGDWRADAARRDFTINAMSMNAGGEVFDYFDGLGDLRAGKVRFVGVAAERIAEDYLRILRFFRFFARYGRGAADEEAMAAIAAGVSGLGRLSVERVWGEIKRILVGPRVVEVVGLMRECGVLRAVLPEAGDGLVLASVVAAGEPGDAVVRLAALISGDGVAVAERLRLSGVEAGRLVAVKGVTVPGDEASDDDLRRALAGTAKEVLIGASWLAGREGLLRGRLSAMAVPVFPLKGRDLAGVTAGPAMGALLRAVREWWLAGGCLADRAGCLAEVRRLMG